MIPGRAAYFTACLKPALITYYSVVAVASPAVVYYPRYPVVALLRVSLCLVAAAPKPDALFQRWILPPAVRRQAQVSLVPAHLVPAAQQGIELGLQAEPGAAVVVADHLPAAAGQVAAAPWLSNR